MTKWQYKVARMDIRIPDFEDDLNRLGDEGWELFKIVERNTFLFRRPGYTGLQMLPSVVEYESDV